MLLYIKEFIPFYCELKLSVKKKWHGKTFAWVTMSWTAHWAASPPVDWHLAWKGDVTFTWCVAALTSARCFWNLCHITARHLEPFMLKPDWTLGSAHSAFSWSRTCKSKKSQFTLLFHPIHMNLKSGMFLFFKGIFTFIFLMTEA